MKVLFAVNDEKDAEAITRVYQKEYKEIISSKTVYYFNAIIKELQKDKTYDRIVISEDLELFSSDDYQEIDNFIFEKMDTISDEATNVDGNDIPIILLCMDRRTKNDPLLTKLFGLGMYNILVGQDRSIQKVARLMYRPRTKKEAKAYYRVDAEGVSYSSASKSGGVSETEIQNILNHYNKIGDNIPKCVQSFESIAGQYTKGQIRSIIKVLPKNVKVILEENSDSYRKIMGIKGQIAEGASQLRKTEYVEKELDSDSRLTQPVIIPTAVSSKKMNRVLSPEELERRKAIIAKKKEQERLAKERAEQEAREEEERIAREKAKEEAERKKQERIARQKAKEEAERKEQERIAKQKAKEEAERKEQERIAKQKAKEEAERKEQEKMTKNNEEDEIKVVKRGRGRPRKNPIPEINENSDEENVPVKRKRGRPRKNPIPEPEIVEEENTSVNDIDDSDIYSDMYNENYDIDEDKEDNNDEVLPGFEDYDDFEDYDETENNSEDDLSYDDIDEDSNYEDANKQDNEEFEEDEELPGFEDYDETDNDDNIEDLDEYDDDFDDYADEDYDESDEELPGFEDEEYDEEDDEELPGFEDEELPQSESKNEDEFDDELPGFEDYDVDEADEADEELPQPENINEDEVDDELPGFEDYDVDEADEELPQSEDKTAEEQDEELPGFEEESEDNVVEDEAEDELPQYEEPSYNVSQNTGSFKGIKNRNYKYDSNLASSIKDLRETEESQSYNIETDNLIASDKKVVAFVGTSKNGTSFIVNNLAATFSQKGIKTAILDLTKNKNSYYVYTNNEDQLKEKAQNCLEKLVNGEVDGIDVNKNLSVFTALPGQDDSLDEVKKIIQTLIDNYTIVLLDCDFNTDFRYFKIAQEIYLVQSLDVLTIQPLTAFLRDLKVKGLLEPNKLRIVINKNLKMNVLNERRLIGGMSVYSDPAMTYMTELFNEDTIKYTLIPFEEQVYAKYLKGLINCEITLKGYPKNFLSSLNKLSEMVYPVINGKKQNFYNNYESKNKYGTFSSNTSSVLDRMKRNY